MPLKESPTVDDCADFDIDDSVSFIDDISKNEIAIICYVAGYIGFTLSKRVSCSNCGMLFLTNRELPEIEANENNEFIDLMTRGRLKSPSDPLLIICKCIYTSFVALQSSQRWFDFLRLRDPASALASVSLLYIRKSHFSSALNYTCLSGHVIEDFFPRISRCFFNTMAKNYVNTVSQQRNVAATTSKVRKLKSTK